MSNPNTINGLSGSSNASLLATAAKAPSGMGLGKDAFMKLLLAQLKYQDPMQPKDDTQFITQLAQFNTLEQMSSINDAMQSMRISQEMMEGSNMIGKQVKALSPAQQDPIEGVVTGVRLMSGQVIVSIGDKQVLLSQITQVGQVGQAGSE